MTRTEALDGTCAERRMHEVSRLGGAATINFYMSAITSAPLLASPSEKRLLAGVSKCLTGPGLAKTTQESFKDRLLPLPRV